MSTKLTVDDPVPSEVMAKLSELQAARNEMCAQYVEFDNFKVQLQVSIRKLDEEVSKVYSKILHERDIQAGTPISISGDGRITLIKDEPKP